MRLAQTLAPLVDFAFPARCPLCGAALGQQNGLCQSCWAELEVPPAGSEGPPVLRGPETDIATNIASEAAAQPATQSDRVYAASYYNDAARSLVLALKYRRRIALGPLMARLMAARLAALSGPALFIPVPLHRWRLWRRGFNQSALLAREIVRLRRRAGHQHSALLVDGLLRHKATPPLAGLNSAARAAAMSGVIKVNPRRRAQIEGANIILVDDVLTSGATSGECAKALRGAGARSVSLVCFARARRQQAAPDMKDLHGDMDEVWGDN